MVIPRIAGCILTALLVAARASAAQLPVPSASVAQAQEVRPPARPRMDPKDVAVIALVGDSGLGEALGMISRHRSGAQRNIIRLRRSSLTPGVIAAALRLLTGSRMLHGRLPAHTLGMWVLDKGESLSNPAAQRLYELLLQAAPFPVWGVGTVPAIAVPLSDRATDIDKAPSP